MTLVYRAVPSLSSSIRKFEDLEPKNASIESVLYQLGFVDFEYCYRFFKSSDEILNTFQIGGEECKYFYLFPQDAVMLPHSCIEYAAYGREWEILEYDIPEDILLDYCGYGFYDGKAIIEFCIPKKVFENNENIKIDDDLLTQKIEESNIDYINNFNVKDLGFHELFCKLIPICFQAKRDVYKSTYVTYNKILLSFRELYENDDFIDAQSVIDLLCKKGITRSDEIIHIYDELLKSVYQVYNKSHQITCLKKELVKVLPLIKR